MKKIIPIIGVICLAVGLLGAGIMLYNRTGLELGTPFKHEQSTDGKPIASVTITSDDHVDIEVVPSTNEQVTATFTGNKQKNVKTDLTVKSQGNTLEIKALYKEPERILWNPLLNLQRDIKRNKVVIALPKKLYTSVNLQTNSGNLRLNELQGKQLKAKSENGDITLEQTDGTVALQTINGNIRLNNHIFRGENAATTENGDVDTQSNNQPITTTEMPTSHLLLSSINGNVKVNGFRGQQLTTTTENGNLVLENIDATFTAHSINGNVDIHMGGIFRDSNQATTENGDIRIATPQEPTSLHVNLIGNDTHSDFPVAVQHSSQHENQPLQGLIGSKTDNTPSLIAQSQNGNVSLGR